jgi:quercetin dioxygenase-like cupin family protein
MFHANDEVAAIEMFPGVVRRTLNSGERTTLIEIALAAGATVPAHTHLHEQIGYVAQGRVRFVIGNETRELAAGDSYLVPGGVSHEVAALEASVCIDVFSPVREEYL